MVKKKANFKNSETKKYNKEWKNTKKKKQAQANIYSLLDRFIFLWCFLFEFFMLFRIS